jgi:hypothetical protein
MEPRFKVLDSVHLATGGTRYRIYDSKEPGNANKHGVYDDKPSADAACSKLNAQRFQVVPPQPINLVQGFEVKDEDYRPAYEAIHFHIIDSVTGKHTGDDFEHEADAIARAAELERLTP